jgi:hypothetical protein
MDQFHAVHPTYGFSLDDKCFNIVWRFLRISFSWDAADRISGWCCIDRSCHTSPSALIAMKTKNRSVTSLKNCVKGAILGTISCVQRQVPPSHQSWCVAYILFQSTELRSCIIIKTKRTKLNGLSPRANYTDRATAACRWSDCQLLRMKGETWSTWRIPTAVLSVF